MIWYKGLQFNICGEDDVEISAMGRHLCRARSVKKAEDLVDCGDVWGGRAKMPTALRTYLFDLMESAENDFERARNAVDNAAAFSKMQEMMIVLYAFSLYEDYMAERRYLSERD